MFCGTLLYQFFGGPDNYAALVDKDKESVRFGPDIALDSAKKSAERAKSSQKQAGIASRLANLGSVSSVCLPLARAPASGGVTRSATSRLPFITRRV
jgi:hypothetical protein